jgi:hypothetical protein
LVDHLVISGFLCPRMRLTTTVGIPPEAERAEGVVTRSPTFSGRERLGRGCRQAQAA